MEGLNLKAVAHVKLTKLDADGNIIETLEHDVDLTEKEAEALWQSQTQE